MQRIAKRNSECIIDGYLCMLYSKHTFVVDLLPQNSLSKFSSLSGYSHKYCSHVEDLFYPIKCFQSGAVLLIIYNLVGFYRWDR